MRSNGRMRRLLWIQTGGSAHPIEPDFAFDGSNKIAMTGSEVFKVAVREMCNASQTVLDEAGVSGSDLALVVPHQANIRIVEAFAKRLGVDMERVQMNIEKYGNTSAAAVPIALDEANRDGRLKPGDLVLLVAFGGGLIWGAALVRW
jgi:3-oxoacyl-[acyl-carrier-protein] synthase-3